MSHGDIQGKPMLVLYPDEAKSSQRSQIWDQVAVSLGAVTSMAPVLCANMCVSVETPCIVTHRTEYSEIAKLVLGDIPVFVFSGAVAAAHKDPDRNDTFWMPFSWLNPIDRRITALFDMAKNGKTREVIKAFAESEFLSKPRLIERLSPYAVCGEKPPTTLTKEAEEIFGVGFSVVEAARGCL